METHSLTITPEDFSDAMLPLKVFIGYLIARNVWQYVTLASNVSRKALGRLNNDY